MTSIKKINAVFIYVKDMSAMRDFYEDILGLNEPIIETDMWVEYEFPGAHLAFHQGDPRISEQNDPARNSVKFSLEVDDLEAFCQVLKEKGVQFAFEPKKDFGSYLAEIKDVEGNPIRLFQYF